MAIVTLNNQRPAAEYFRATQFERGTLCTAVHGIEVYIVAAPDRSGRPHPVLSDKAFNRFVNLSSGEVLPSYITGRKLRAEEQPVTLRNEE